MFAVECPEIFYLFYNFIFLIIVAFYFNNTFFSQSNFTFTVKNFLMRGDDYAFDYLLAFLGQGAETSYRLDLIIKKFKANGILETRVIYIDYFTPDGKLTGLVDLLYPVIT